MRSLEPAGSLDSFSRVARLRLLPRHRRHQPRSWSRREGPSGLRGFPGGLEEAVKLSELQRWWCGQLRPTNDTRLRSRGQLGKRDCLDKSAVVRTPQGTIARTFKNGVQARRRIVGPNREPTAVSQARASLL